MPRVISELISEGSKRLESSGIGSPRLESEILLSHLLKIDRAQLYSRYECPVPPAIHRRFKELINRRRQRYPLAYILKRKEFYGLGFYVDPSVMIPRPETETLVDRALEILRGDYASIIEIGTGCGAIAIAIAKNNPNVIIWASDISQKAVKIAIKNAKTNGVSDRVHFLVGDMFRPFDQEKLQGKMDLIICNPPYVTEKEWRRLEPEIFFEPRCALLAGRDGLTFYRRVIRSARGFLKEGRWLLLEICKARARPVMELLKESGYIQIRIKRDLHGIQRVMEAKYG